MEIVLCRVQDYVDAFEKLLHLTSKQSKSQREAVHIVFKLCLGEKTFNEFYAHLLDKLCGHHRQLQVSFRAVLFSSDSVANSDGSLKYKYTNGNL